ncbi:MAG TPA: hypothetical protein VMG41_10840 [Gemmatimonadales bacterium]|nr:hypothetical protein [Gemmatimonadales bacterium]
MTDTSPTAARVQIRVLQGLTPSQRLDLAVQMSLGARALVIARLRAEHPEWPEAEVRRETLRLTIPGLPLPRVE